MLVCFLKQGRSQGAETWTPSQSLSRKDESVSAAFSLSLCVICNDIIQRNASHAHIRGWNQRKLDNFWIFVARIFAYNLILQLLYEHMIVRTRIYYETLMEVQRRSPFIPSLQDEGG